MFWGGKECIKTIKIMLAHDVIYVNPIWRLRLSPPKTLNGHKSVTINSSSIILVSIPMRLRAENESRPKKMMI